MFVLSHGRQFMFYTLVECHQVTAQPVVRLYEDINSCYKKAFLALKSRVRFFILNRILMLRCGSCCVGPRQFFRGPVSQTFSVVWCDLCEPKAQKSSFWQTFCLLLHSLVSWLCGFPGFRAGRTQAILFPESLRMGRKMFLSCLATSHPIQYRTAGRHSIRSVGCDVVADCCHFSI